MLDMCLAKRSFGGENNRNSDMGVGVYQASTLRRFSNQCTRRRAQRFIQELVERDGAKPQMEGLTTTALTSQTARSDMKSRIWGIGGGLWCSSERAR